MQYKSEKAVITELGREAFFNKVQKLLPELVTSYGVEPLSLAELNKATFFKEVKPTGDALFVVNAFDKTRTHIVGISHTSAPTRMSNEQARFNTSLHLAAQNIQVNWSGVQELGSDLPKTTGISIFLNEIREGIIMDYKNNLIHFSTKRERYSQETIPLTIEVDSSMLSNGIVEIPKDGAKVTLDRVDLSHPELIAVSFQDQIRNEYRNIILPRSLTYGSFVKPRTIFDVSELLNRPTATPFYPNHPHLRH